MRSSACRPDLCPDHAIVAQAALSARRQVVLVVHDSLLLSPAGAEGADSHHEAEPNRASKGTTRSYFNKSVYTHAASWTVSLEDFNGELNIV
jgi:hypothetical protein